MYEYAKSHKCAYVEQVRNENKFSINVGTLRYGKQIMQIIKLCTFQL